jgi:two-component system response regulator FlrC
MPQATILVVEQEPETRGTMTHMLTQCGYQVQSVADGHAGLEKFRQGHFGLMIADCDTAEMQGTALLTKMHAIAPQVPVILTTGNGSVAHAVAAIQEGAADYLLKPVSQAALEVAVRRAWGNDRDSCHMPHASLPKVQWPSQKEIITEDEGLMKVMAMARNVAPSNATILIQGESGTGKEVLAAYIHRHSGHLDQPYVAVNCAALPDNLVESELFGHEKGAFTGAVNRKSGKFEQAGAGTLVLDEISEMPLTLQAKLLRVLQERQIDRVGGSRPVPVACRIIAITNADLPAAVQEGKFREDLFYRINVIPLSVPPLRRRVGDILILAEHFLEKFSRLNARPKPALTSEAASVLIKQPWKGNVRELENAMERAVLITAGECIRARHLFLEQPSAENSAAMQIQPGVSVRQMERTLIYETLKVTNDNRTQAARMLGISIRTLRNKLSEYRKEKGLTDAMAVG